MRMGICLLAFTALFAQAEAADRPNFVIMMTDDQRFDAMSSAGNRLLQTPNMDRISAEGFHFRNMFVTNSLCAPSRCTLLTGKYSHAHGVKDNRDLDLATSQPIFPELLKKAGYQIAFCGKSHVKNALRDRDWDYYFGYRGQGDYLKPKIAEGTKGEEKNYTGWMDDVVTDHAVTWLKEKRDQPFCLFLFFKAPHRPWTRAPRHKDLFANATIAKPDTWDLRDQGSPGKSRAFHNADNRVGTFDDVKSLETYVKDYSACITGVDENIGKVLAALSETGQLDQTAVFFTADNGFFQGEWQAFDKRLMHEPSLRVPLLVRYPKLIKAGSTTDKMALNVDIAPTVLELAGVPVPTSMHGRSLVPLLEGNDVPWRQEFLYEYFDYPAVHSVRKHRGVRTERYKLIHFYPDASYSGPAENAEEFELYDLEKDPGERTNLYGREEVKDLTEKLRARLEELRHETGEL